MKEKRVQNNLSEQIFVSQVGILMTNASGSSC